jgi:hypothetical protein
VIGRWARLAVLTVLCLGPVACDLGTGSDADASSVSIVPAFVGIDAIGGAVTLGGAGHVTSMPRPVWLERLRAKRAASDARIAAGPVAIQGRARRLRVG